MQWLIMKGEQNILSITEYR